MSPLALLRRLLARLRGGCRRADFAAHLSAALERSDGVVLRVSALERSFGASAPAGRRTFIREHFHQE